MKALSIRQPWAHAVLHFGKRIENRSWHTAYRGPILIHASKWWRDIEGSADVREMARMAERAGAPIEGPLLVGDLARGGIVGRARIVDCVSTSSDPWFTGPFGFVLADVEPLPFVPYRGELGLFDVPDLAEVKP